MKKTLITLIFCIIVLGGLGYGWWWMSQKNVPIVNTNANQTQEVMYKGIIRSKNIALGSAGTHELILENGDKIVLESKKIALSNYLDQSVEVVGMFTTKQDQRILEVAEVRFDLSANMNQNGNQHTFIAHTTPFGLSFRYSSLFSLGQENQESVSLLIADKTILENNSESIITLQALPDKITNLKDWVMKNKKLSSVTIRAGNKDAERIIQENSNLITIYILTDRLYELRVTIPSQAKQIDLIKNKFYEMLTTFTWKENTSLNGNTNQKIVNSNQNVNQQPKNNNSALQQNMNTQKNSQTNLNAPLSNTTTNSNTNMYSQEVSIKNAALKNDVIAYIKKNIENIAPQDNEKTGTLNATKFEFADPDFVYVEYTDGKMKRKLLLRYFTEERSVKTTQLAYFKPGETQDWITVTGSNVAAQQSRDIFSEDGQQIGKTNEGMRIYENAALKYSIQYPTGYYYAGVARENGATHQVQFTDKPSDTTPTVLIKLQVFSGTFSSLNITSARMVQDDTVTLFREKEGKVFKISGPLSQETMMGKMYGSIEVK